MSQETDRLPTNRAFVVQGSPDEVQLLEDVEYLKNRGWDIKPFEGYIDETAKVLPIYDDIDVRLYEYVYPGSHHGDFSDHAKKQRLPNSVALESWLGLARQFKFGALPLLDYKDMPRVQSEIYETINGYTQTGLNGLSVGSLKRSLEEARKRTTIVRPEVFLGRVGTKKHIIFLEDLVYSYQSPSSWR